MDNNKTISLKEALNVYLKVLKDYKEGYLEGKEFACSAYEAHSISRCMARDGIKVEVEYEDGHGGLTKELDFVTIMTEPDLTGYVSFDPVKKATFLKKDVRFAEKWRQRMLDEGFKWIQNPNNPDAKISYDHAQRYHFDILKKVFWVVDLGG